MCFSQGFDMSSEELLLGSSQELQAATNSRRKAKRCKALGCKVQDLGGRYCRKKRLCEAHMKADSIEAPECGPGLWRYCQQCGKLEPLHRFEGTKRSCRISLVKRKANADKALQQRQQQQCTSRCQQRSKQMELLPMAADAVAPIDQAAAAGVMFAGYLSQEVAGSSEDSGCTAAAAAASPAAAASLQSLPAEQLVTLDDAWAAVAQQQQQQHAAIVTDADVCMLSALVEREISSVLAAAASLPSCKQQLLAEAAAAADGDELSELEIEALIEAELAAAGLLSNGQLACCNTTISTPQQQQQQQQALQVSAFGAAGGAAAPLAAAAAAPAAHLHSRLVTLHAEFIELQQAMAGLQQLLGPQGQLQQVVQQAQQQPSLYTPSGNHSSGSWFCI